MCIQKHEKSNNNKKGKVHVVARDEVTQTMLNTHTKKKKTEQRGGGNTSKKKKYGKKVMKR